MRRSTRGRLAYIRRPEGIIVLLAEQLGSSMARVCARANPVIASQLQPERLVGRVAELESLRLAGI